jgi:hypothetical protein
MDRVSRNLDEDENWNLVGVRMQHHFGRTKGLWIPRSGSKDQIC